MAAVVDNCDLCKINDNYIIAQFYCFVCEDRLCEECRVEHRKNKASREHSVLPLENINGTPDNLASLGKLSKCKEHPNKELKYLCEDHNEPFCKDCVVLKHRQCSKFNDLKRVADEWTRSARIHLAGEIEPIESMVEQLRDDSSKQSKGIEESKAAIDKSLEEWELVMVQAVRETKTKAQANVHRMATRALELAEEREKEIRDVEKEISEIKDFNQLTEAHGSLIQKFLLNRELQKPLKDMETCSDDISRRMMKHSLSLKEKHTHEIFLTVFKNLFLVKLELPMYQRTAKLTNVLEYKGGTSEEKHVLWLDSSSIMISDPEAKLLSLIDTDSGKVISMYTCTNTPRAMVKIPDKRIVVAVPDTRQLFIVSVQGGKLIQNDSIQMDKPYHALAHFGKKAMILASSQSDGSIDLMTYYGTIFTSLQMDQSTKKIVKVARSIAFNQNQEICYISCNISFKVLAINLSGDVVFEYNNKLLASPCTVLTDSENNVYVTCWANNVIHQIDDKGRLLKLIGSSSGQLKNPSGLAFNQDESVFVVITEEREHEIRFYGFS